MNTKHYTVHNQKLSKKDLADCTKLLQSGELVAFPTETVYGLGANALAPFAISKIFTVKNRPMDNPLILHVNSIEMARKYVVSFPPIALKLAAIFWPGPLTLILYKNNLVPGEATAGLPTVAIRIPSHPVAISLITACDFPLAAPSANLSGKPSTTDGWHVQDDLEGLVSAIIDGGKSTFGIESTVLDLTSTIPTILRPGSTSIRQLEMVIPKVIYKTQSANKEIAKSPGMKYTHYSPKAPITIVKGTPQQVSKKINELANEQTGILCIKEHAHLYNKGQIIVLGSKNESSQLASNLFDSLRMFDKLKVTKILTEYPDYGDLKEAIVNRIEKAAGGKIIKA